MSTPDSTDAAAVRGPYGAGHVYTRTDRDGREVFYGRGYRNGRRLNRRLGLAGGPGGITGPQARGALGKLLGERDPDVAPALGARVTIKEAGAAYVASRERLNRKPSTVANIRSELRWHLEPFLAGRTLNQITTDDVDDLIVLLEEEKELAPKTIRGIVSTLSAICKYGRQPRRRWCDHNPCDGADLPALPNCEAIRYLTLPEVELAVQHARPGLFQDYDRVMFRMAAMTGLRLGEFRALRWRDVDMTASKLRVHRNYVKGVEGTPKSRRSFRTVPMAPTVAADLAKLWASSRFTADDDLVFAHPITGRPIAANVSRRFQNALEDAGLEPHRFHDLRHTFGTMIAASGRVSMRRLQEWMGHRDFATTLRYADFAPSERDAADIQAVFAPAPPGPETAELETEVETEGQ